MNGKPTRIRYAHRCDDHANESYTIPMKDDDKKKYH